jgi:hypothetical protein
MQVTSAGDPVSGFVADPSTCLANLGSTTTFAVTFDARVAAGTARHVGSSSRVSVEAVATE